MSTTTSIRLPDSLRLELETVSQQLHRGKNWLIAEAIKAYLENLKNPSLQAEAKRQSLLAAQRDKPDTAWEESADTQGWT